jgi:RNA binding exosome subunit
MLVFVNLELDNNYILREVTLRVGLQPSWKKLLYLLYTANKEEILEELVIDYKVNTTLYIHRHKQRICLDVIRLANYNIILGILWLQEHNLQIDWIT